MTDENPKSVEDRTGDGRATRGRVLVVEDDPLLRKMVLRILEKQGYVVEAASDGVEAVEAHAREVFDAILMDCQMPRLDGFEATKAIRAAELSTGGHTPIIALTALQGARGRCLAVGMDDHLTKPVHPTDLAAAIAKAISETSSSRGADSHSSQPS